MSNGSYTTPNGTTVTVDSIKDRILETSAEETAKELGYASSKSLHRVVKYYLGGKWESKRAMQRRLGLPMDVDILIMQAMFLYLLETGTTPRLIDLEEQIEGHLKAYGIRKRMMRLIDLGYVGRAAGLGTNSFILTEKGQQEILGDHWQEFRARVLEVEEPKSKYEALAYRIYCYVLNNGCAPSRKDVEEMVQPPLFDVNVKIALQETEDYGLIENYEGFRRYAVTYQGMMKILPTPLFWDWQIMIEDIEEMMENHPCYIMNEEQKEVLM